MAQQSTQSHEIIYAEGTPAEIRVAFHMKYWPLFYIKNNVLNPPPHVFVSDRFLEEEISAKLETSNRSPTNAVIKHENVQRDKFSSSGFTRGCPWSDPLNTIHWPQSQTTIATKFSAKGSPVYFNVRIAVAGLDGRSLNFTVEAPEILAFSYHSHIRPYLLQREPRMIEVDPETRDYSKAVRIWGTKFGSGDRVMRCRVHQGDVMGPAKTGDVQYLSDSEVLVTLPAGLEPGHCFIYLLREEPDCDVAESPAAGKAGRSANRSSSSQAVATEPYPGGKAKPKNSQAPPRVRMTLADGSTTWAVESHNFVHIFLNSPKKQDTNITIPVQSPQSERTDPDSPYSQSLSPWDYGSDNWSPGSNFSSDSDSMSPFFSGDIIGEGTFSMKRHLDYAERNVLHIAVLCRNAKLLSAAIKRATKLGVIKALLTGTDCSGYMPLHWAASIANQEALDLLLAAITENYQHEELLSVLESTVLDGQSALFRAVIGGNANCVQKLLEHGADPNHLNDDLLSPLDVCAEKNEDIRNVLIKFGGKHSGDIDDELDRLLLGALTGTSMSKPAPAPAPTIEDEIPPELLEEEKKTGKKPHYELQVRSEQQQQAPEDIGQIKKRIQQEQQSEAPAATSPASRTTFGK